MHNPPSLQKKMLISGSAWRKREDPSEIELHCLCMWGRGGKAAYHVLYIAANFLLHAIHSTFDLLYSL